MGRKTQAERDTRHTCEKMIAAAFLVSALAMVSSNPMKEMLCPQYTELDHSTFYPNPEDCGSFYMCSAAGTPVLMPCPSGLHWNSSLNVCDWPDRVECEDDSGESSSSEECEEGATNCKLDSSSSEECEEGATNCELDSSSEESEGEDKLLLALRKQ